MRKILKKQITTYIAQQSLDEEYTRNIIEDNKHKTIYVKIYKHIMHYYLT